MYKFRPSNRTDYHSAYGDASAEAAATHALPGGKTTGQVLEELAPVVSSLFAQKDAQRVGRVCAQAENWDHMAANAKSAFLANFYALQANKKAGECEGASADLKAERRAQTLTQTFKGSGIALVLSGVAVAGALAYFLVRKAQ